MEDKQTVENQYNRQKWRRHKMTQCIGKREIQDKRKTYVELRDKCQIQTCYNLKKQDRLSRDLCLHKCVNEKCFKIVYKDLEPHENLAQREIQVKTFRQSFVKCVEEDAGTRKYYPNIRAYCIKNYCTLVKAEGDKIKTEMCIHKCVNLECYKQVYKPLIIEKSDNYVKQQFSNEKEKDLFIDQYKWEFVKCYQQIQQKQQNIILHGDRYVEEESSQSIQQIRDKETYQRQNNQESIDNQKQIEQALLQKQNEELRSQEDQLKDETQEAKSENEESSSQNENLSNENEENIKENEKTSREDEEVKSEIEKTEEIDQATKEDL